MSTAAAFSYNEFYKDYDTWQNGATDEFFKLRDDFYSSQPGGFSHAYVVEVSPSGGKSTWSMKLAQRLIEAGLIDKAIWVVPRKNIKDGFAADVENLQEMAVEYRLQGEPLLCIDTDIGSNYNGMLNNYHGFVINYQSLPRMLGYIQLLASASKRLLIVLDEAHHGSTEDDNRPPFQGEEDEIQSVWGDAMEKCKQLACAIVCMTGTPIRSDNRKIPYFRYEEVQGGWKVKPDFKFTYADAVRAGVARQILCRSQNPTITYQVTDPEKQEIKEYTRPVAAIPMAHFHSVKNTIFDLDRGIVDAMLREASKECAACRAAGDHDAAILVIVQRDFSPKSKKLDETKRKIRELFGENAVTVHSEDEGSRDVIKAFKTGMDRWIVAKEMISEGTNIPRIRVILILRDIGNPTFYQQLVHRATRNDADDRPEDAFIIQAQFPHLHQWCMELQTEADLAVKARDAKRRKTTEEEWVKDRQNALIIQGLFAEEDTEAVSIKDGDYSDTDPTARVLYPQVAQVTFGRVSRTALNDILKIGISSGAFSIAASVEMTSREPLLSRREEIDKRLTRGRKDCEAAGAIMGGDVSKNIQHFMYEAKKMAGITGSLKDLVRDHPDALEAAKKFEEAARRARQRVSLRRTRNEGEEL